MSVGQKLQAALVGALGTLDVCGAYDGPPARAHYPYIVLEAGPEADWSHKTGEGREVIVAVTIWDDQPARLMELTDAAEAAVLRTTNVEGWQLVSLRLIRRRTVRDVAGPWAAAIDFRARLLAN